jgi:hypothetical protein
MKPNFLSTETPVVFDDFFKLDTAATNGLWLSTNDGATGTLALSSSLAGGWISVPSAAADNDYQQMSTQQPVFKLAAASGGTPGTSVLYEARFKLTEANTSAANFVFGLSSVLTTGFLASDGGGVPASFSGAVLYKVDGTMSIKAASSNGSTQTKDKVICAFTSGNVYTVSITIDVADSTTAIAKFWVLDETGIGSAGAAIYQPDRLGQNVGIHRVAVASLAQMYPIFGVKAGSSSAETLSVDYVYAAQTARG